MERGRGQQLLMQASMGPCAANAGEPADGCPLLWITAGMRSTNEKYGKTANEIAISHWLLPTAGFSARGNSCNRRNTSAFCKGQGSCFYCICSYLYLLFMIQCICQCRWQISLWRQKSSSIHSFHKAHRSHSDTHVQSCIVFHRN